MILTLKNKGAKIANKLINGSNKKKTDNKKYGILSDETRNEENESKLSSVVSSKLNVVKEVLSGFKQEVVSTKGENILDGIADAIVNGITAIGNGAVKLGETGKSKIDAFKESLKNARAWIHDFAAEITKNDDINLWRSDSRAAREKFGDNTYKFTQKKQAATEIAKYNELAAKLKLDQNDTGLKEYLEQLKEQNEQLYNFFEELNGEETSTDEFMENQSEEIKELVNSEDGLKGVIDAYRYIGRNAEHAEEAQEEYREAVRRANPDLAEFLENHPDATMGQYAAHLATATLKIITPSM